MEKLEIQAKALVAADEMLEQTVELLVILKKGTIPKSVEEEFSEKLINFSIKVGAYKTLRELTE